MKGKIRKIISLALMAVMLFGCFGITGCRKNEPVTDGEFIYEYRDPRDSDPFYVIIGSTEEGQKYKENVYVPTHYNGVPIRLTFTTESGAYFGTTTTYSMQVNCKNLYFNYIQEYEPIFHGKAEYVFFPVTIKNMAKSISSIALRPTSRILYVSQLMYNYIEERVFTLATADRFSEINKYILHYEFNIGKNGEQEYYLVKADTAYLFNYENSPNNDYFFINNFGGGSLIENTPYAPIREGYAFAGWYKEPECIHAWNFNEDRLPKFEYDSNGYITNFVETKLYAKWIKK